MTTFLGKLPPLRHASSSPLPPKNQQIPRSADPLIFPYLLPFLIKMELLSLFLFLLPELAFSQIHPGEKEDALKIHKLIADYSLARETRDTALLRNILTEDVDQLISSGEWRNGIQAAIDGMLRSSTTNPGSRKLQVEKIKFLSDEIALVDCRYSIISQNGNERNMWSSFTVIFQKNQWEITAIRNMNPSGS